MTRLRGPDNRRSFATRFGQLFEKTVTRFVSTNWSDGYRPYHLWRDYFANNYSSTFRVLTQMQDGAKPRRIPA